MLFQIRYDFGVNLKIQKTQKQGEMRIIRNWHGCVVRVGCGGIGELN